MQSAKSTLNTTLNSNSIAIYFRTVVKVGAIRLIDACISTIVQPCCFRVTGCIRTEKQ